MKRLLYILCGSALLLSPVAVFAQVNVSGSADAQVQAGTDPMLSPHHEGPNTPVPHPFFPTPDNIRKLASTTREQLQDARSTVREIASTTRAAVQGDRADIKTIKLDRAAAIKTMIGSSTPEQRQQIRQDSRAAIEVKRADIASTTAAAKAEAQAKFSVAVQTSVSNITDALTQAAANLGGIADRIDARITQLQGQGKPMTASAAALVGARADIATAQDKITAVGAALTAALASATPKTQVPKIRDAVKAAEDALHTAKASLQITLESLRVEGAVTTNVTAQ